MKTKTDISGVNRQIIVPNEYIVAFEETIQCMPAIEPCEMELEFTHGTVDPDSEDECSTPSVTSEVSIPSLSTTTETPVKTTNRDLCVICQVNC